MKKRTFFPSLIISLALCPLFLAGCADVFHPAESVSFRAPSWPPDGCADFPPLSSWRVICAGRDGEKTFTLPDGGSFGAEVLSSDVFAVRFTPVVSFGDYEAEFFRPAGCVYPMRGKVTWEGGFAADVCVRLYDSMQGSCEAKSRRLSKFNWRKFIEEAALKCASIEGVVCDPWLLDVDGIVEKIIGEKISSTNFKPTTAKSTMIVMDEQSALDAIRENMNAFRADGAPSPMLIPRYIPSWRAQRETGKIRLVKDAKAVKSAFLIGDGMVGVARSSARSNAEKETFITVKSGSPTFALETMAVEKFMELSSE